MSIVKRIFSGWGRSSRKAPAAGHAAEHAVELHLELTGGQYGSEDEVEEIRLLGDDCEEALLQAKAGVFEGEEFGDAACILFFTGPDAERIWQVLAPVVTPSRLAPGGFVVQRQGGPGAQEVRQPLTT